MDLSNLIRPRNREAVVQRMLTTLSVERGETLPLNFAPTNYVAGDPLRTVLEITGEGIADTERTVMALAEGGYLETAGGEWLDALVESHYGLTRQPSVFARGLVRFYAPPNTGVSIPTGMIVGTASGLRYHATDALALNAGESGTLEVRAESPGAAYNAPVGTITVLHTPIPGVAATNQAGWLLEAGAELESDEALRRRARLRWAELGGGATRAAYEYWAYTAHASVDRVTVLDEHPRGQGTVDVVVWGTGGLGADALTAVNAYIQERRPLTADVAVYAATELVQAVPIELYAPFGDRDSIAAQVETGLAQLQRDTPIGGMLYHAQVVEVAMLPAGVLDAVVDMPDLTLEQTQALTLAPRISWRDTP